MNKNIRLMSMCLAFALLASMAIGVIPRASASPGGPATPNMLIRIYFDPTAENNALDAGTVDINDWPLSKEFVDKWSVRSDIQLREYSEIGNMEIDMNNQWWPTGAYDPGHSSAAPRNNMFIPTNIREVAALHFRRAVAHLTNKDKYTTVFMGGMGFVMETEVPVPALAGYTDYSTLKNTAYLSAYPGWPTFDRADNPYADFGFIYEYDREAAAKELELGGFVKDGGVYKWDNPTTPPGDYEDLPNMKFWIRIDDPNRRMAGEDLYNEMVTLGIPAAAGPGLPGVEKIVTERSACFNNVMVLYNYNFYTGGWSLSPDLDFIHDLYHSSMGQYSWAQNYPGFKNDDFDQYAEQVKYPVNAADIKPAAIKAQWVKAKYIPVIELWAAKGVKAYRTGWEDVVNMAGYGVDESGWPWSFLLMHNPADNTIDYGFKSDVSALHVISSEWLWDWMALGQMYDMLLIRNPYNLPEEVGCLAEDWSVGTWGTPTKTVVEFKVRTDATFHDGTPVKPADVAYSLLMPKAAGAGVAWNYPMVMDVDHVDILGQTVKVYFGVQSAWALHWAGFMYIINKDLWEQAIGLHYGTTAAGYTGWIADDTPGTYYPGTFSNAMAVRDYHPWERSDMGNPAVNDLAEDGGGPWKFVAYALGESITMSAFTGFYPTVSRKVVPGSEWEVDPVSTIIDLPGKASGTSIVVLPSDEWEHLGLPGDVQDEIFVDSTLPNQDKDNDGKWDYTVNGVPRELAVGQSDVINENQVVHAIDGARLRFGDTGKIHVHSSSNNPPKTPPDGTSQKGTFKIVEGNARITQRHFVYLAFNKQGNTNYEYGWGVPQGHFAADIKIDADDRYRIRTSMPSYEYIGQYGTGEVQFHPDFDITGDGAVDIDDKVICDLNYGKVMG